MTPYEIFQRFKEPTDALYPQWNAAMRREFFKHRHGRYPKPGAAGDLEYDCFVIETNDDGSYERWLKAQYENR